jgi:hypothetical protein
MSTAPEGHITNFIRNIVEHDLEVGCLQRAHLVRQAGAGGNAGGGT